MANMIEQAGTSVCPITRQPVQTGKYVHFVPLRPAREGERPLSGLSSLHVVPAGDEQTRAEGKLFASLLNAEDLRHLVESLDWSRPWQLRHKPPRKVCRIALARIAGNPSTFRAAASKTPVLLDDGRCVAADFRTLATDVDNVATIEVDYGVLQCVAEESALDAFAVLSKWRGRLIDQLLA